MGTYSIWHWIIALLVIAIIVCLPLFWGAKVCRKAGYSRAWTFAQMIPVVNIIIFWVFAFSDWPTLTKTDNVEVQGSRT